MTAHKPAYANLPPCPYCGGTVTAFQGMFRSWVDCDDAELTCGASGPICDTKAQAVIAYYTNHPAHRQYEINRRLRQAACVVKRGGEG